MEFLKILLIDIGPCLYVLFLSYISYQRIKLRKKLRFTSYYEMAEEMNQFGIPNNIFYASMPLLGIFAVAKIILITYAYNSNLALYLAIVYQLISAILFLGIIKSHSFKGKHIYLLLEILTLLFCFIGFAPLPDNLKGLALVISAVSHMLVVYSMGCTIFLSTKYNQIPKDK